MNKIALLLILLFTVLQPTRISAVEIEEPRDSIGPRQNHAPIFLLHGFTGWGRDEAFGFNYWGGLVDIQEDLREQDYLTYTTASGPYSSSWDRTCEIYAQIKGGRVDYGKIHARNHGHTRFGRTYSGFYPEWGKVDPVTGKLNKVHLIGHSQGGIDSRILVQFLVDGHEDERINTSPENLNPLFSGNHDWVFSVTTLSAPHNGTTLASNIFRVLPNHQKLVAFFGATWSALGLPAYDWKLSQWGLERKRGESFTDFQSRIMHSRFWRSTRDNAAWTLSPEGARENNRWVKAQPGVFYFSYSSQQTHESWFSDEHKPDLGMFTAFRPLAEWMGEYTEDSPNRVQVDKSWFANDGIVNTISMNAPKIGSNDEVVEYDGIPQQGIWNHMGLFMGMDHFDYLGMFNSDFSNPRPFFRKLADYLGALPDNAGSP